MVRVLTGAIWRSCDVSEVANGVAPTPEAIAEAANISIEAARAALKRPGEYTLAGWVNPTGWDIVPDDQIPAGAVEIDRSRQGDPVYETEDGVWEPFYVVVCPE